MQRNLFIQFALPILCSLTLFSCKKQVEKSTLQVVHTQSAIEVDEKSTTEYPFISKPYRTSDLSFRVGGIIQEMDIHPGKFYHKGEVIASLDSRDYQIRFDKAKALYEQAESEYKRADTLYKLNNISASVYEKSKADYQSALATYNTAQNELTDNRLLAPFDGYIQEVYFEQHQDVKASQPICSFIEIDKIKMEIYVPQQIAMSIKEGETINAKFDALPQDIFNATIEQVSKGTTKNNLSFLITATLSNKERTLPSGMSGKLSINHTTSSDRCVAIDQKTIRHSPTKGTYVWVNHNGRAKCTPVVTGKLLKNGFIEILDGINCGDKVISTGLELLDNDTPIKVVDK